MSNDLSRFLDAQESVWHQALSEIRSGQKESHWMWFIFPQIAGLGYSSTAKFYAIKDREEAVAYLENPVLGERLRGITKELLQPDKTDAKFIFGHTDAMKLLSCMTLFALVGGDDEPFMKVIEKFFNGKLDSSTLEILEE
jgi:uncharacterized protein (DUF1810 family)